MKLDIIEYYIHCLKTPLNTCLGLVETKCKYYSMCSIDLDLEYITMIYSEGE